MRKNPYSKDLRNRLPLFMQGPGTTTALTSNEAQKKLIEFEAKQPYLRDYLVQMNGTSVDFSMIRPPLMDDTNAFYSSDFYNMEMGQTEVTWDLYHAVTGRAIKYSKKQAPVTNVTLYDCVDFCNKLSIFFNLEPCYKSTKRFEPTLITDTPMPTGFRLPTRKEWILFAQAGTKNTFPGCDDEGLLDTYASFGFNPDGYFVKGLDPVATKKPNEWGLYDMSGNAWEWTSDFYEADPDLYDEEDVPPDYLIMGGSMYTTDLRDMRVSNFQLRSPKSSESDLGFRICRNLDPSERRREKV